MPTHFPKLLFSALFFLTASVTLAQTFDIAGPIGSGRFGKVTVLTNGNYVVVDANYDEGGFTDIGAVYLYNGSTHALISTLKGSSTNDRVGNLEIVPLTNGNFVVNSYVWSSGKGAVTWVNGTSGLSGVVSSSNSIVGTTNGENIGYPAVTALANGNYIVASRYYNSMAGAVTWGSGTAGVTGIVSATNSFVGTNSSSSVSNALVLSNSNYVVTCPSWNGGFGAAVWCSGTSGRTGTTATVNSSNSLVGSTINHFVGSYVQPLTNGNYVVGSYNWDNGATADVGAVTWCNGTTGRTGTVSTANSLYGGNAGDQIGWDGVTALSNGNYIVFSQYCDNGAVVDAGSATWCDGSTGRTGAVSAANSLVGSSTNDNVGISGAAALTNGNYVVISPYWDNGSVADAGAVTWGSGTTGVTGVVTTANSLVGSTANDNVGTNYNGITSLTNGNYVVKSSNWDSGAIADAGAATWCNGSTGRTGLVGTGNSMIGSSANDQVGSAGIAALSNGNYVIASPLWDNGAIIDAGLATWGDGTNGTTGLVSSLNSLIGSTAADNVADAIFPLTNGNYVVRSYYWDNGALTDAGAVTWCNGTTGYSGIVGTANSLVGSSAGDIVGYVFTAALNNGNYVVSSSSWNNGVVNDAGAVTLSNGATGKTGIITSCNSVLGTTSGGGFNMNFKYNYTYNYLIVGRPFDNIVTIFDPTGMALAVNLDENTVNINGAGTIPLISNAACRIIGTIAANGASPVSGSVTAKVWKESSVPVYGGNPFVARHYEITPATNAATATGRVTLYFTQEEFTDFNNDPLSGLDLPTGPSDGIGIANLRVIKYSGTSSDNSGLPGSYPGSASVIDPADADIAWKSNLNRWEVSFDVIGFSGFFIQTNTSPLPLSLLEFNGHLKNNNGILNWKTTAEINVQSFDIERSFDGRNYVAVGNITAANQPGTNSYFYTDNNITALNVPVVYYRLKQKDINGYFKYSGIVALPIDKNKSVVLFYPNPVTDKANLSFTLNRSEQIIVKIFDNTGRLCQQHQLKLIAGSHVLPVNVKDLTRGKYYLELKGDTTNEHISFIKE